MLSDIEIARQATLRPIVELAQDRFGIAPEHLDPYGHYKAKLSFDYIQSLQDRPDGKLILVTAISPTPAGEGKTTTTVGLGDALNRIGKKALICLREPSLGPCFGIKGGAAGGGRAQVVPMEDINLHFTGDFHAIGVAHNLLSALADNHIHHGNALDLDVRQMAWKRVIDMNDRNLRQIVEGLGGRVNGVPREDGFDIVVASEVMAILCLVDDLGELKRQLGKVLVGHSRGGGKVFARDLKAQGAMAALLKDAIRPNLVQTLENNLAFVHGGPFANIAHGCNTAIATKTALKMADYVVTEAGFGADLGAEKFIDIKCRKTGLRPDAVVLVATVRALKMHGGVPKDALQEENLAALETGFANLERHFRNIREQFGLPCVVAINHFVSDTEAEIRLLTEKVAAIGGKALVCRHWAEGGAGAETLAREVVNLVSAPNQFRFLYEDDLPLWEKIKTIATRLYGAAGVSADSKVRRQIEALDRECRHFPICMAKTQYSFACDPELRGAPTGHTVTIREVRPAYGAEFIVVICGNIMTMPGLPKSPAAERIDIDENGQISGLF
ncbi:formate--tetrahydrofolate ligase [Methylomarinovum caldicuralii]|uniref:Formate--tetrahydrofolate ligase n=1 Tax=Methylomarinovum caldicuralii TaxID=438856 RepID=A0AAU9BQX2_9GAMM|nr:formate--tetrahydrofolate ligase [Methylomarinovum caldicuralii]BCX80876.1 formate--tetrahydrofolate ligase [Methylomarinovum caldicuralii]